MEFTRIKLTAWNKDVIPRNNIQKVCFHSKNESMIHFLIKSMLSHIIFSKGDGVITEAEFTNGRVIDVLQVMPTKNLIGYEIENKKNNKHDVDGVDIIEINVNNIPYDVRNNTKKLYDWLKVMVV